MGWTRLIASRRGSRQAAPPFSLLVATSAHRPSLIVTFSGVQTSLDTRRIEDRSPLTDE